MFAIEDSTADALSDRGVVSARVLDAPRELVFRAFSDPDHLVHWWGPRGFKNTFHEFDLRPGGFWRSQGPAATCESLGALRHGSG